MVFIAILKPEVRSLILATIILGGTRRFKSQPPHQLSTWLLAPPVSTVHAMPWRKDHSVSPQMSPSRPDGSLRGWMKGKFYRTTSGRFKKLSNDESQENSYHAESAYRKYLTVRICPRELSASAHGLEVYIDNR